MIGSKSCFYIIGCPENRQGWQVIHGLQKCLNKHEYVLKTVKRINRKITTYWTQIILPQYTLSQTNCISKQLGKTRNGQTFLNVFRDATGPSNGNSFKSQRVKSLVSKPWCHCSLTNEFTLWDLKKWTLLGPMASRMETEIISEKLHKLLSVSRLFRLFWNTVCLWQGSKIICVQMLLFSC